MITVARELITPAIASAYLATGSNVRRINREIVTSYERQMRCGAWSETHQGIAFDESGVLVDGFHRLAAVVNSGLSIHMLVARGLAPGTVRDVDRGKARTLAQALATHGIIISGGAIAILRVIEYGLGALQGTVRLSAAETERLLAWHGAALAFVQSAFPAHERGFPALLTGLVGRATYTYDTADLLAFAALYSTQGDSDNPARDIVRRLYRLMCDSPDAKRIGRIDLYRKSARALRAFLDRDPVSRLHADMDPDLAFPIPDHTEV